VKWSLEKFDKKVWSFDRYFFDRAHLFKTRKKVRKVLQGGDHLGIWKKKLALFENWRVVPKNIKKIDKFR
jgi:hypothetical protein